MEFRVGIGADVHRWVNNRPLMLGGVHIPHDRGLLGHSDADALLHAITDAILGGLALGDIGTHFPDNDPQWKDCPSSRFVTHAAELAKEKGWRISNIDASVMTEYPKLKPHMLDIRTSVAELLSINLDQVGIKAGTMEKLGFVGREEGILIQAIVALVRS